MTYAVYEDIVKTERNAQLVHITIVHYMFIAYQIITYSQ